MSRQKIGAKYKLSTKAASSTHRISVRLARVDVAMYPQRTQRSSCLESMMGPKIKGL